MIETPDNEGLVLDAASHRYTWNGRPVGGVSQILQALGLVDPTWFTPESRDRGTAVHRAVQLLAEGRLDWSSVDPRILGYVQAGDRFLRDAGVPIGECVTERIVYHPAHRYAGKLDLFAECFGSPAVVDFKSGALGHAGLQTAAYEDALRQEIGGAPARRMAVQLREDGTYRKHDYKASSEYLDWFACCRIFNTYHTKG